MSNKSNYRVQQRYANPEAVRLHSGKESRWIDVSEHQTKSEAKKAMTECQRVIKICTPSEFACLKDTQAYSGRRFNVIFRGNNK